MRNAAFAIFRNFAFAFPLQVPNLKVDLHLTAAAEIAPKYIYRRWSNFSGFKETRNIFSIVSVT